MIKKTIQTILFPASIAIIFLGGCNKNDEPLPDVRENELITTVRLKFVNKANAGDVKLSVWKDLDGEGGNAPIIDPVNLSANSAYTLTVDGILNETSTRSEDVKAEILAEADNHLFVFKPAGANIAVVITDKDSKGLPLGLEAAATTSAASSGTLRVILRHQIGNKDGTEIPGSTDIDTSFPVVIQ